MPEDDLSRADALRATNDDGVRRRCVLGGVVAAVGTALGASGAAAALETEPGDSAAAAPADAPYCEPGCRAERYCCEYDGETCVQFCWYCNCS